MATSEKDLQKLQAEAQKLRDSIAAERARAEAAVLEQQVEVNAAELNAEIARLNIELDNAKENTRRAKAAHNNPYSPLSAAQDEMRRAVEAQKAAEALRKQDAKAASDSDAGEPTVANVVSDQATTVGAPDATREV